MKCINMKIVEILFFVAIFISIKSLVLGQAKTTTETNEEISKRNFLEECPHLMNIVRDRNLENFTINCKAPNNTNPRESVLQQACFVVREMFINVCNKNLNETYLDLPGRSNTSNVCPFNFSHVKPYVFKNYEQVIQLEKEDFCETVCYVLYSTETQCVLLSKFNNYIKAQSLPAHPEVGKSTVGLKIGNGGTQKTSETLAKQPSDEQHQSSKTQLKEVTTKTKTETISRSQLTESTGKVTKTIQKEKKTENPIMSSGPREDIRTTERTEAPKEDVKSFKPSIDELISRNEDTLPDEELSNEDNSLGRDNSALNKELKEKDSYAREGFTQPEDSHLFFYFIMVSSVVVVGYLAFHNKNKILAYALEGSSSRRSRRRPNPARYRKLETNLEEAISSNATNAASSTVVY